MAITGSNSVSDGATGHSYRATLSRAFADNRQEGSIIFTNVTPATQDSILLTTTNPSMIWIRNRYTADTTSILRVGIVTAVYDIALFPGEGLPWPINNVATPGPITIFFTGDATLMEFEYQVWPQKV